MLDTIFGVFFMIKKRNKFCLADRERAVEMVLGQGKSYCSVARQLQTSDRLVSRWVNAFRLHGIEGLSLKNNGSYSGALKLRLIREMQENALSLHQMSAQYLITPSALSGWRRLYEQHGASALLAEKPRGRPPKMKKSSPKTEENPTDYEKLLKENERLRIENDYLKKVRALIQKKEIQKRGRKPKPSKN
jgi:transposase